MSFYSYFGDYINAINFQEYLHILKNFPCKLNQFSSSSESVLSIAQLSNKFDITSYRQSMNKNPHHPSSAPTEGPSGSKKADPSLKDTIVHYAPSIVALIPFAITLSIALRHGRHHRQSLEETEDDIDYQHYLYLALEITTGVFFFTNLFLNFFFGKMPSNYDHHSPLYGRLIEGAQDNLPLSLAIGNSILTFAGGTVFGSHAKQSEHAVSGILTAAVVSQRVTAIDYRLYDHAMDRSLLLNGDMRWLEYVAMRGENAIIYVLESIAHVGLFAVTVGLTRIQITDENRLYLVASIYKATDIAEDALVLLLNEYIYYLETMADRTSPALRAVGLANPERPVHAVTPRTIDKVDKHLQAEIAKAAHAVEHAAEEVGTFFSRGWNSFTSIFKGGHTSHSSDQHRTSTEEDKDNGGGKMSPEELDAYNAEQEAIAARNNEVNHSGVLDGLRHALHLSPSVTVDQRANGSHSLDFASLPSGNIHINNLPDASTICLDGLSTNSRVIIRLPNGQCYECKRVASAHHAGGMLRSLKEDHEKIGNIDGNKVHSYQPAPNYVLVRIDECDTYEMSIHSTGYIGDIMPHHDASI